MNIAIQPKQNLELILKQFQPEYQANTWVQLLHQPSEYSYDEALLLCQLTADRWVAWIPDCGEAVLDVSQFCALGED